MTAAVVNYTVFVKEAAAVTTTVTTVTETETTVTTTATEAAAEILRGDVDCNKVCDVSDADCNGDGNRTSEDVTRLLQYIAKMIPEI